VGLKRLSPFAFLFLTFGFANVLGAAPMLRLTSATVGPVSVAPGASGPAQIVEAYNAGDGALSLSLSSSVSWISASVGAPGTCRTTTASKACIPLQIALNTGSLGAASTPYTGIVTVSADSNTIDAPQTITITVQVGGGVPWSVDVYVAPGSSTDTVFYTNSQITSRTATQDGAKWLTVAAGSLGSFQFVIPYHIRVAPQPANAADSTYNGSITTSGSTFADDNKTIPVTMRVTTQPIAQATTNQLTVRLAQGAPPLAPPFSPAVGLINAGTGTLVQQPLAVSGGSWISASAGGLTFDSTGLDTGDHTGSIALASNAVNGSVTVPVDFQVVAKGPPLIYYQGVLDNATFIPGDTVAQGDVMVVKGEQLSFKPFAAGQAPPLANQVADTAVLVNGNPAPIFYTSYGQIAFQMPVDTPAGTAVIQVQRTDGAVSNPVSVTVAARAPKLLQLFGGPWGAIVNADGCGGISPCTLGGSLPLPASFAQPGYPAYPAKIGDTITIYAIGLGPTAPPVSTGAPAPSTSLAQLTVTPTVVFGGGIAGIDAQPSFAGLTPTYAGLYQINVTIPPRTPKGIVPLSVVFPGSASNSVQIAVQ
jgi:uncharacterized protein (TIGR03437 family)